MILYADTIDRTLSTGLSSQIIFKNLCGYV